MTSPITIPKSTVYAILVTHTTKGKPRKRLAWGVKYMRWEIGYCDMVYHVIMGDDDYLSGYRATMIRLKGEAESALGCRCAVVEITLTGKVV